MKDEAIFVFLEHADDVAPAQVQVGRVREKVDELRIRHAHAAVYLVRSLHHFIQVVVDAGLKTHFARRLPDEIKPGAHGPERGIGVLPRFDSRRRKDDQMARAEILQEPHRLPRTLDNALVLRRVVHRASKRNRGDIKIAFRDFPFELRRRHIVSLQDSGKAGQPHPDKTRVTHDVEDLRERRERVMRPQSGAQRPPNIAVCRQDLGRPRQTGSERSQKSPSLDHVPSSYCAAVGLPRSVPHYAPCGRFEQGPPNLGRCAGV